MDIVRTLILEAQLPLEFDQMPWYMGFIAYSCVFRRGRRLILRSWASVVLVDLVLLLIYSNDLLPYNTKVSILRRNTLFKHRNERKKKFTHRNYDWSIQRKVSSKVNFGHNGSCFCTLCKTMHCKSSRSESRKLLVCYLIDFPHKKRTGIIILYNRYEPG